MCQRASICIVILSLLIFNPLYALCTANESINQWQNLPANSNTAIRPINHEALMIRVN